MLASSSSSFTINSNAAAAVIVVNASSSSSSSGGGDDTFKKKKREIKVCTKKECKRLGSQKTLEFLEARGEKFNLKVTSVKCLSECGMGPNVELPCGTVLNRVKGEESCLKALARTLNEGEECDFVA
jgi:hypothetical protein